MPNKDSNNRKKPQVVYLHGMQSSGRSVTVQRLQRSLPHHDVIAPDIPVPPEVAVTELRRLASMLRPDAVVVGTSMGGMYAQLFRGFKRILINPSFHTSRNLSNHLGERLEFHNPRLDGVKDFEVNKKLLKKYEKLESQQFDPKFGISSPRPGVDENSLVVGFFGTQDTVVNCREEFLSHYSDARDFEGGHRLDPNSTITLIVPEILGRNADSEHD